MSRVFPGVAEVFARFFRLVSMLMSDDLPTLLLPMNAYSGSVGAGHFSMFVLLTKKSAVEICMENKLGLPQFLFSLVMKHPDYFNLLFVIYLIIDTERKFFDNIFSDGS